MKTESHRLYILAIILALPGSLGILKGQQPVINPENSGMGNISSPVDSTTALVRDPDLLFEEAIGLYESREYERALDLYRRIEDAGEVSADLYYNMGNAAFRSHSIGYSILYYERALKLEPGHENAAYNLEYVKKYREDVFEEVPEFFLRSWLKKLSRSLPERSWSILALSAFLLSLVLLLFYLFSRSMVVKKSAFFSAMITLIIFIFTLWNALVAHKRLSSPSEGIIVSPSVVVRSTPSETGTDLFILHEGSYIDVQESLTDWQNIRITDGREGWIRISDFEFI